MSVLFSSSPAAADNHKTSEDAFPGFTPLEANYLYCPNQFFDICLPHASRGTVRLVAYMLRKTLGWLDQNGQPVEQNLSVSYQELITEAGISRGAIRPAIEDAIAGGYIVCLEPGRAGAKQQTAQAARYALHWDAGVTYCKSTVEFQGFYTGEGHRSPIPNAFFDCIVPNESLTVIKVVGAVLRHTVGYESQFGRRAQAPLSFSYLQQYARIGDRKTLSQAIQEALKKGYIRCVEQGTFHPRASQRRAASYAVKWLSQAVSMPGSSKTLPAERKQSKNPTSSSSKSPPAEQFKNPTIEKKPFKNTFKQQVSAVVTSDNQTMVLLVETGFDKPTALELSKKWPADEIERQIAWLPHRGATKNPLGLLRRAIEESWSEPAGLKAQQRQARTSDRSAQEQAKRLAQKAADEQLKRRKQQKHQTLLAVWLKASSGQQAAWLAAAIEQAPNGVVKQRLRTGHDKDNPPREALEIMSRDADVSIGESA